jgi:hypothetical protein
MVIARQELQICPPMIPFCSRFDSVLFTPKMPAFAGRFNFSRSPQVRQVFVRSGNGRGVAGDNVLLTAHLEKSFCVNCLFER